jgi:hypothetical protein
MPTDPIPELPSFHSGFFVKHDHDETAPPEGLTVIERDANGMPCFACFFEAMFESLPIDQYKALAKIDISGLEDDIGPLAVRIGATVAYLADAIAWVLARGLSVPEETVPLLADRLHKALKIAVDDMEAEGVEPLVR